MARGISEFKTKLINGGARPNLFLVRLNFPQTLSEIADIGPIDSSEVLGDRSQFLVKTAQLPASTIAEVTVPFRGRNLKVAGDRTFEPWTVTIINDEDFQLRTAFERWMNVLSKLDDATGVTNPSSYMTDAYVQQLGRGDRRFSTTNNGGQSSVLRTYKFYDIFPTEVSAIDLSYDTTNDYETFDVTFQVQYFTVGNSLESSGSSAGEALIE